LNVLDLSPKQSLRRGRRYRPQRKKPHAEPPGIRCPSQIDDRNADRATRPPHAHHPSFRINSVKHLRLSVALGHTLQLVLLLDGVAVAAALGRVDQLLGQALGNALDVAEGGLARTDGEEGDGLVDAAQGRDIDGLAAHGTRAADTGAVFAGTAVDDGVDGDLDGVLVGHDVDLERQCG